MVTIIRHAVYYSLIVFTFLGCKYGNKKEVEVKSKQVVVDTCNYVVLGLDSTNPWLSKRGEFADLNLAEIETVDSIVRLAINSYNKKCKVFFDSLALVTKRNDFDVTDFMIDYNNYKRQYVPFVNSVGEKEVWDNCFCDGSIADWTKEIVVVEDGGKCYFNLVVNLKQKSARLFMVNGEA